MFRVPDASRRLVEIPRSGIRRVLERVGASGTVNLAAGDPDFGTPAHIVEAGIAALRAGETHYTHGRGLMELRTAFAKKLAIENALEGVDPETEIVVTAGALNALAAVFLSVVDPGDRVIVPDPGFANYRAQIALAGGEAVGLPLRADERFAPDLHELERLAPTAKVIVVNSPGNPTGGVLDRATLEGIARIATRHELLVIADEAYEHLLYDSREHVSIASLPDMRDRTVTLHSMSKSWAMTGWRIGFATGPAALMDEIAKAQEHIIGCPPAMNQWAAVAALTGPTDMRDRMVERYAQRRDLVLERLSDVPGIDLARPDGAFYAFPSLDIGVQGIALAEAIAEGCGVITIPGSAFGQTGGRHVRISYAVPEATLVEGLDRLSAWRARRRSWR